VSACIGLYSNRTRCCYMSEQQRKIGLRSANPCSQRGWCLRRCEFVHSTYQRLGAKCKRKILAFSVRAPYDANVLMCVLAARMSRRMHQREHSTRTSMPDRARRHCCISRCRCSSSRQSVCAQHAQRSCCNELIASPIIRGEGAFLGSSTPCSREGNASG
jgi:hypothetical protein